MVVGVFYWISLAAASPSLTTRGWAISCILLLNSELGAAGSESRRPVNKARNSS